MKKIIELSILLILLVFFIFLGKNKLAVFYYNRGNNYYDQHLYKEAIDYFSKSLKINPSAARVHYSLANAYMEEELEDRAIEEYKIAVIFDKGFAPGYKALAHIYLARENYQDALGVLRQAGIIIPENREIQDLTNIVSFEYTAYLLNSGVDAFSVGDKSRAHELLNKALQINPNFVFTRYTLGYFYYIERKYDEAEAMLNEAILLDSKFFLAHKVLGDIYFEKKVFSKAIEEYKSALAINKGDAALLNNIGLAYMNLENYNEAIPFLKEALSLDPQNINIRYSLASVYRDSGRLKEASLEYRSVINAQPGYPNVHNDLGDIYKQQGRTKEAFEEYRREIYFCRDKLSSNPSDAFVLADMSHAYNGIGEYYKAKELIDKALAIKPDYRQGYLTLANIYRNLGNSTQALAALEKAKGLSAQRYFFIEESINDTKKWGNFSNGKIEFHPQDTVYLKNGRLLKGRIKEETEDRIILELKAGSIIGTVTLSRDTIERIVSEENK